jgi:hypothetical protein
LTDEGDAVVSINAIDQCIAPYQIISKADGIGAERKGFEAGFDGDLCLQGTGNWEQGTEGYDQGEKVEGRG